MMAHLRGKPLSDRLSEFDALQWDPSHRTSEEEAPDELMLLLAISPHPERSKDTPERRSGAGHRGALQGSIQSSPGSLTHAVYRELLTAFEPLQIDFESFQLVFGRTAVRRKWPYQGKDITWGV